MRGPREIRRWLDRLRSRYGRDNGVVKAGLFDNPEYERKLAKSFKQRARRSAPTNQSSRSEGQADS